MVKLFCGRPIDVTEKVNSYVDEVDLKDNQYINVIQMHTNARSENIIFQVSINTKYDLGGKLC